MVVRLKWPPKSLTQCGRCPLHETRKNVVVGRGVGNYKGGLMFMGEAPGRTEDALAEPFIGESGNLLDKMLLASRIINYYISNTILCRPIDEHGGNRAPRPPEVFACTPNLQSILNHVRPSVVCFIGRISERYYKGIVRVKTFQVTHPAAILRVGGDTSFAYKDAVKRLITIRSFINANQTEA